VRDVKTRGFSTKEKQKTNANKNMKRKFQIIVSASAATVLAYSALAQDTSNLKTDGPVSTDRALRPQRPNQLKSAAKASDVIGKTVLNNQGEKLGKVEDLAVDVESGRIVQVILSSGGFIGIGDRLTAVPPEALHCDADHKVLHLDADKEKLANAPKFEPSKWGECSDANHLAAVYRYYGEEPAFKFIQRGDAVPESQPNTVSARKADGTWNKDRLASGSQCMIPESRLGQVQKASKLMGTSVKNLQEETVGNVENILVDLPSGRIVAFIVSSGGFLRMDGELSAIPPAALRFTADPDTLQLDTSKELLGNAPHFKADQWPDFAQPGYAGDVYRAYNVEPYFNTNATTEADNTARNVSDRTDQTLTPLNQGTSHADVGTTAQIRKEIIAAKEMSLNARNVKIITIDGRVTLRGPVNTAEEKRLIGEIANRIAGVGNVDNQLEVKLTASNN
jgi:hyperosmotically inducible periplasmic protein